MDQTVSSALNTRIEVRAQVLLAEHQDSICRRTDRLFGAFMILQWLASIVVAIWTAPHGWTGEYTSIDIHVWIAVSAGGVISIFPAARALLCPGQSSTRMTIAGAQMLMSSLIFYLSGDNAGSECEVFGSIAFLALYRDSRVFIPATLVIAVDHLARGLLAAHVGSGIGPGAPWY